MLGRKVEKMEYLCENIGCKRGGFLRMHVKIEMRGDTWQDCVLSM